MEALNNLLDQVYFGLFEPFFAFLGRLLELILIKPFALLQIPIWINVALIGLLTALFAFWLRKALRVEEKSATFNKEFGAKREEQKNLQLLKNKYHRSAAYEATDDDLNKDFNTYIANHYVRYVLIYLLPIFFILAWLNSVFSETFLRGKFGAPFIVSLPSNGAGVKGLSVTFVFLITYVLTLIIGFQIRRRRRARQQEA